MQQQAWLIRCNCRPLFSRLRCLKRRRRRSRTRVAFAGKDGTKPGEMEFVISGLADRAELAVRAQVLNKQRGITSRPLMSNLISNTFSHNLCQFSRIFRLFFFRLGKREKKRPAAAASYVINSLVNLKEKAYC